MRRIIMFEITISSKLFSLPTLNFQQNEKKEKEEAFIPTHVNQVLDFFNHHFRDAIFQFRLKRKLTTKL